MFLNLPLKFLSYKFKLFIINSDIYFMLVHQGESLNLPKNIF